MLKEQLVALSLELDDKRKIEELLRRKIATEKASLPHVEQEVQAKFQSIVQDETRIFEEKRQSVMQRSQQLMDEKEKFIQQCKTLVDEVTEMERDIQAEIRGLHRQHTERLEAERRQFRSTYEERLQKFLANKANEYKAATEKAMDPEFSRLALAHQREVDELEASCAAEERKLRELSQQRMVTMEEDERQDARNELTIASKALQDRVARELEQLVREHRRQIHQLHDDGEHELEKQRLRLAEKAAKLRAERHDEVRQAQEQSQKQLLELRKTHLVRVKELEEEHEKELQAIHLAGRQQLQALGAQLAPSSRSRRSKLIDNDDLTAEDMASGEEDLHPRSPLKLSPNGVRGGQTEGWTPEHNARLQQARAEAMAQRDRILQSEIRAMETELLRLEREWKAKAEAERQAVLSSSKKEEEQLQRRQRQLTTEIADLAVEREQIYTSLQALTTREETLHREVDKLRKEIGVYKEGIQVIQQRGREKEEGHRLALREVQLQHAPIIRDLREQCEEIQSEMKALECQWEDEMRDLEKAHAEELARLNDQVREDVATRDRELALLRDEVDEEQVRRAKLSALLSQYNGSSAAEIAASATAGKPRSRRTEEDNKSQHTSRSMATASLASGGMSRTNTVGASSRISRK